MIIYTAQRPVTAVAWWDVPIPERYGITERPMWIYIAFTPQMPPSMKALIRWVQP